VNDYLDRDGSRTPVQFHISNDYDKNPIDAQVVQAAFLSLIVYGPPISEYEYL